MANKESRQLARNYAEALLEQASSDLTLQEEFHTIIESINDSINSVEKANLIFESPAISSEEKKKVIGEIISKSSSEKCKGTLLSFLSLLIDKQRFDILPDIQIELKNTINENLGVIHAEVSSAKKLNNQTLEKIKSKLEKCILNANEKIKIETLVEPKLIGGIKVKIKDLVYDGSIKSKLDNIRRKIS